MTVTLGSDPNGFATELFDGLPRHYDRLSYLLSMGQDRRWRHAMIEKIGVARHTSILDVATGPGGVALALRRSTGAQVIGVDLSHEMLERATGNVEIRQVPGIHFVQARAEELPFGDATFDALTVTYLLRYVADARATIAELARTLKPGGVLSSMEFAVPTNRIWHAAWWAYTRGVLPVAGWLSGGREWYRVGRFLGPNITEFYRRLPVATTLEYWAAAGITDVHVQTMSLGGGIVMWGTKGRRA